MTLLRYVAVDDRGNIVLATLGLGPCMGEGGSEFPPHSRRSCTMFETKIGYSRAVRLRNQVRVSGTVVMQDGEPVAVGDAGAETWHILTTFQRDARRGSSNGN